MQLLSPHAYELAVKPQAHVPYHLPLDSSSVLLSATEIITTTSLNSTITSTTVLPVKHNSDDTGMYQLEDETYCAFVSPSPKLCSIPWPRMQVVSARVWRAEFLSCKW
ncbi:hypothetical protein FB446DRAFT_795890 [Lentinula raphanica]|nr:hypothetical protein FB446DRAFT_795890 [Lentinula raphanica]